MKSKILVIDDSGLTRNQVRDMLEQAFDAEVLLAADGNKGWEMLLGTADIQVIVADIEMPGMNGVELVKRVREHEDFMYLPVVVMSTLGQVKERDNALNNGADAFIQKPVTIEALRQVMFDLL
jgi:two-component system sensor histidine kinase and response regulator WspE